MQALSSTSQRRSIAPKFAMELRRAIKAANGSTHRVSEASGIPRSNLGYYLAARNLPTVEVAQRLADLLDAPKLLDLVLEARTIRCGRPGCTRTFVYEGGKPKVYCSEDCASLAQKMRSGADPLDDGAKQLYQAVKAEVDGVRGTTGALSRKALDRALKEYARSGSKRHAKITKAQRRLDGYAEAIDAMCRGCEPEGLCRTAECPLRAFSPLPLAGSFTANRRPTEMREVEGAWGPTHRAHMLAVTREANRKRWSRPGEREAQSLKTTQMHSARTPAERQAWIDKISAAKVGRRPAGHGLGPRKSLDPDEVAALQAAAREGARPDELAEAYGISRRTAYRYLAAAS